LRCAFVGALIPRKGVATAIAAVAGLGDRRDVTLDLYGPGDVAVYGALPPKIAYRGSIEFGRTESVLADYDVLLVPSLHDGWGVVVNEGIMAGCAVIASHETGASALVDHFGCGATFAASDVDALRAAIAGFADDRDLLDAGRLAARNHRLTLLPEVAGAYMAACIASLDRSTAPEPAPWY
jgi:glycosyltransferase involved in cell wall biosynthesis